MNNFIAMRSFLVYLLDSISSANNYKYKSTNFQEYILGAKIKKEILFWYIPIVSTIFFYFSENIDTMKNSKKQNHAQ